MPKEKRNDDERASSYLTSLLKAADESWREIELKAETLEAWSASDFFFNGEVPKNYKWPTKKVKYEINRIKRGKAPMKITRDQCHLALKEIIRKRAYENCREDLQGVPAAVAMIDEAILIIDVILRNRALAIHSLEKEIIAECTDHHLEIE